MSRLLIATGLLFVGLLPLAADDIDRILGRDKIAAEKLLSDVSAALSESAKLEKTSPGAAVILLERRISEVREATYLSGDERASLVGKLSSRLKSVNESLR